jgi:hypothetical protein
MIDSDEKAAACDVSPTTQSDRPRSSHTALPSGKDFTKIYLHSLSSKQHLSKIFPSPHCTETQWYLYWQICTGGNRTCPSKNLGPTNVLILNVTLAICAGSICLDMKLNIMKRRRMYVKCVNWGLAGGMSPCPFHVGD